MGICGHRFLTNRRFFNEIVTYQKVFCMVTQLGSASNDGDDDGNRPFINSDSCHFDLVGNTHIYSVSLQLWRPYKN